MKNGKRGKSQTKRRRKRTRWSDAPINKTNYESALAYAGNMLFNSRTPNTPLPLTLKSNLRFCEKNSLNIGVGGIASTNVYNASSLYDPNTSGIGAQPRGFDQLMALYNKYLVIGAKITVYYSVPIAVGPVLGCINLKSISTVDSNIVTSMESSYSVMDATTGDEGTMKLTQTYSPAFLGIKKPLLADDLYGTDSSNPSNSSYFHVLVESAANTDEGSVPIFTCIEYSAIFMDPIRPAQS